MKPAAVPPPWRTASNRRAAVAGSRPGAAATLRWRRCRRWPYSSQRRSSGQLRVTWLSLPRASGTPAASQRGKSHKPSPRLASVPGHSTTPAPLAATALISCGVACVACTSCQRASSRPSCASHSTGRAPVAARQSSTSAVCSATWMCTGPSSPCNASASACSDSGRAARSECTATPAVTCGRRQARMASRMLSTLCTFAVKRRWSSRSAGCWKPARSYSTGSSVRPMPVATAASASARLMASGSG